MSDEESVTNRAYEYETRVDDAGGTEGIIHALVRGAERNNKIVKYVIIGIVFNVFISIILFTVVVVLSQNTNRINKNAELINNERLISALNDCLSDKEFLNKYNIYQNDLAKIEKNSLKLDTDDSTLKKQVHLDRIKVYEDGLVPIPDCSKLERPTNVEKGASG